MSKLKVNELSPFSSTGISVGGSPTGSPSIMWDFQSTSQGITPPRMTTAQRNLIISPVEGLLIYNLDDHRLEQYASGMWTVVGNGLSPVMNILRVIKNPVLNAYDFSSINDALASITDNSPTNQYVIEVGPGTFIENSIHMKPYVYIKGADFDSTVISANNPTDHLIFACDFSSISDCVLTNVTLAGKALVYYASTTGTSQTTFWIEDVRFGQADTLVIADGTLAPTNLFINSCRWGGIYQFNNGFISRTSGLSFARIVIRNSTSTKMTAPYPTDMFICDGANCELSLKSVVSRTGVNGAGGNGVRIRNGGVLRIASVDLDGWSEGLWIENVGANPFIIGGIMTFLNNTHDIRIDHAGVGGGIVAGADDDSKVYINPSVTNFGFAILGLEDGDIVVSGSVKQVQKDGTFTDVTTLINDSSAMGILSDGDISPPVSGFTVNVEAGFGYLQKSDGSLRKIIWPATNFSVSPSSTTYIYFDSTGTLQGSASLPNTTQNIFLGRIVSDSTKILIIEESGFLSTHAGNGIGTALRNGLGAIYSNGSTAAEVGTRTLAISSGEYYYGERQFLCNGGSPITFTAFYQNGSGGFTSVYSQTQVSNTQWDDGSGTLASIGAGNFVKHSLYALGDSTGDFDSEQYFLVYSQSQYTSLTLAEQGNLPNPPNFLSEAVTIIASIITQQGTTNIVEIRDERPIFSSKKISSIAATTYHHNLLGLNDFDDHLRYLPVDGSRPMTGNLPMGTHNVINAGTYNGVTVENHHARHQPGSGLDELITAAPTINLDANTTNATGTGTSLSRNDHSHAISTGTVSTQLPNQANASGTSANLTRADHTHNIPTGIASGLNANSTNTQGTAFAFAQQDHTHSIASGIVSTQTPDQSNSAGTSSNFAKADHIHNIPTAIVTDIGSSNSQGSASSFSRSDHIHKGIHSIQSNGSTQRFGDINLKSGVGVTVTDNGDNSFTFDTIDAANEFVVTTGAGLVANYTGGKSWFNGTFTLIAAGSISLPASQTNWFIYADTDAVVKNAASIPPNAIPMAKFTTGISTITSITDIREQVNHNNVFGLGSDIVTILPDSSSIGGSTNKYADAGHTHAIATAAASTQTPNNVNAKGTSTSFARADHVHNIPTGTPSALTPNAGNSQGTASAFAQQDHIHNVPTAAPANQTIAAAVADGTASTFSRSDHIHTFSTSAASSQTPDQVNAAGTSTSFARADHIHNIATAIVTDIGSANAQGTASSFSRSDHVHKGLHSIKADSGTQRFGDVSLVSGTGIAVSDDGSGNFTINTILGGNELFVTQGSGLTANYTAGKVRINGTTYTLSAGSITVATGATNGRIYVDVDGVVKSTTATTTPPNAVPLAIYSSSGIAITALSDNRTVLNVNILFGSASDITTILPDSSASAGSTNKYADAGHTHAIATAAASTISTNANAKGTSTSFARADHTHQLTASSASLDHVPQFDGTNWQAIYPENLLNIARAYSLTEDWLSGTSGGQYSWTATNTGGGSATSIDTTNLDSNHVGIVNITGGNAANRASVLALAQNHILGGGTVTIECLFRIATLTTAAFRIGLGDLYTGADFNNGVYLEYNSGTSANWLIKTANGGVRTSTTSTVAATANTWHKLLITINSTASSVTYVLDGTTLGTITTNIPTANAVGATLGATSLGAPFTTMYVDYYEIHQRFSVSR